MSPDEHSVFFAVYSTSLTSKELGERVGIEPDESWNRGDRSGRRERERSRVLYDSGPSRKAPANDQISSLLARLAPAAQRIAALASDRNGEARLSVGYFVNAPQWQEGDGGTVLRGLGVFLSSAQVALLQGMGASFDVDIFVSEDDLGDE